MQLLQIWREPVFLWISLVPSHHPFVSFDRSFEQLRCEEMIRAEGLPEVLGSSIVRGLVARECTSVPTAGGCLIL